MGEKVKIGVIICNRYHTCAGGKCMRAFHEREGAFSLYKDQEAEIVGYTSCGGCPGGNVEYAPAEMKKNGANVIHLATCFVVGYPPCSRIQSFSDYIEQRFEIPVVVGTHPIPTSYYDMHTKLGTWQGPVWEKIIRHVVTDEKMRAKYN